MTPLLFVASIIIGVAITGVIRRVTPCIARWGSNDIRSTFAGWGLVLVGMIATGVVGLIVAAT